MSVHEPVSRFAVDALNGGSVEPFQPSGPKVGRLARVARMPRRLFRRKSGRDSFDLAVEQGRLTMGRHSYGRPIVHFYPGDTATVTIGSFCSIAEWVEIVPGGQHRPDWVSTFPFRARLGLPGAYADGAPTSRGGVTVGNDVWIGRGAKLLSGAKIGDGAVVGAYAVVAGEVRPYAIVVGNPAREARLRFREDQIEQLVAIAWWDWPTETLIERIPMLCGDDIDGFVTRFGALPE